MIDHLATPYAHTPKLQRWVRRYMNARALGVQDYRVQKYPLYSQDNHPRQNYAASEYGPCLPHAGTGWVISGVGSEQDPNIARMMTWFGAHVRDALAFNY